MDSEEHDERKKATEIAVMDDGDSLRISVKISSIAASGNVMMTSFSPKGSPLHATKPFVAQQWYGLNVHVNKKLAMVKPNTTFQ